MERAAVRVLVQPIRLWHLLGKMRRIRYGCELLSTKQAKESEVREVIDERGAFGLSCRDRASLRLAGAFDSRGRESSGQRCKPSVWLDGA